MKLAKPDAGGRTHPTYIELQTNRPMYVHRRGSNIVNGEYYVDYNPERPIGHYGQTRKIDTAALRKHYEDAAQGGREGAGEELAAGARRGHRRITALLRGSLCAAARTRISPARCAARSTALNKTGYWPAPLPQTSHPYKGNPDKSDVPGDFGTTHVGDDTDTSPFTDTAKTTSISTQEYLRNMNVLIQWRKQAKR